MADSEQGMSGKLYWVQAAEGLFLRISVEMLSTCLLVQVHEPITLDGFLWSLMTYKESSTSTA